MAPAPSTAIADITIEGQAATIRGSKTPTRILQMNKTAFAVALVATALGLYVPAASAAEAEYYSQPDSKLPFSEAVRAGDFLYVSGQIGQGKDADPTAAFKAAAHNSLDTIAKILTAHGSSLDHVVQCTVMLTDMKLWPTFNEVYVTYFKAGHMPARAAFGVTALAFGAPLEVTCFAYEPQNKR
jgi:2-iminobutanoate/2-iminopropanoate deaminase